ncbi:MAG: SDR family oxidoreductase [Pseudomonadota bacterium]|nr:SDR family oxidoreductase [Pseudomonadota bacterium]
MGEIRYDGRVAVVTGAGAGLGRSHAMFLASRGAKVVVNDLGGSVDGSGGSARAADAVVDEIRAAGGEAVANYDGVGTAESGVAIVRTALDTWGRIDILVNNAGILRDKSFAKVSPADFQAVIDVHLMGSVWCTHAAWPHMQAANYGRIVMTTSAAGLYGNFGQVNYGAAKLGLVGLMNALKQEGRKNNITVHTVAPVAGTRMTEGIVPEALFGALKPELITPAVGWFVAEENEETGTIIECGAGYFGKVQVVEGAGMHFGFERSVTPEDLRENWGRITDMSAARPYPSAMDALGVVFAELAKQAG